MAYTTIDKPEDYFDTTTYTGNGSSQTLSMDNLGMLWMKNRTETSNHVLFDVVRGGYYTSDPGPELRPNGSTKGSGSDISQTYGIGFGSSSSTIGSDGGGYNYNQSGKSYVGWQWRANGSGSTNTAGSIDATVSVNTTSGFSIVNWTGSGSSATLGHGLGATPKLIIVKNLSDVVNWFLYNHSIITPSSNNKTFMTLNTTGAIESNGTATTFTSVSNTTFGVGTDNIINGSSDKMIAYVFSEKQGFSKFGSYTGNGNVDGTFIYTGFSPAFVMVKRTDASGDWAMIDNKRNTFNVMNKYLKAQATDAESTDASFDIDAVSNGFKLRYNNGNYNASGGNYIYMVFAENPFVTSSGVPATAR